MAGFPPHFHSTDEYEAFVSRLVSTGVILDAGMVYWYVRPSARAPTVEVRVADVAATVDETVLQAALTAPRSGGGGAVARCPRRVAAGGVLTAAARQRAAPRDHGDMRAVVDLLACSP